jgi:hypothetical protein
MSRTFRILVAGLAAALASGCPADPASGPSDAGADSGSQLEPDAGAPDAGAPQRRLVTRRLLGDTPIENRFHNPHFEMTTEFWMAYAGNSELEVRRLSLPQTPSGLPALEITPPGRSRFVMGLARGGPKPLDVSVWVGRDANAEGKASLRLSLSGLGEGQATDQAFELTAEEGTQRTLGGILWQRYSAHVEEELLGICALIFADGGTERILLEGPTLVAEQGGEKLAPAPRLLERGRAMTEEESAMVRRALDDLRKRRPVPPPDPADGPRLSPW